MVKMSSDCPEITKMILDIIYGDEGEGNGISTKSISRDGQKVIIENSRGLRLGFFIELAEYFIFFIFKLLCVHKDEKQIFCICMKTRNSVIVLPRPSTRSGIPPSKILNT